MTLLLDELFAPLQVMKKKLASSDKSAYRVYKTASEFVTVEAETALEAFRASEVKNPVRIVREIRFMERMVEQSGLVESAEFVQTGMPGVEQAAIIKQAAEPAIIIPVAPLATVETIMPAEVEISSDNLSPDDVAALLGDEPKPE
jgi:hypothetical protein